MSHNRSERQERASSLIKEKVAAYIQEEANTDPLITVTRVDISPDFRNATVYITTIPDGREQDALVFLKRHGGDLRRKVMKTTYLKNIPFLTFEVDYGERHRQHIDTIVQATGTESTYEADEA